MAESYVRNSSGFQQANQIFVNVGGTYQEVNEAYANVGGTYKLIFSAFEATSFVTLSSGSGTFTVPDNANAIHIQAAVGVISTVKITNNAITADKLERKFTITTNVTPAGGSDGDLWFVYA